MDLRQQTRMTLLVAEVVKSYVAAKSKERENYIDDAALDRAMRDLDKFLGLGIHPWHDD